MEHVCGARSCVEHARIQRFVSDANCDVCMVIGIDTSPLAERFVPLWDAGASFCTHRAARYLWECRRRLRCRQWTGIGHRCHGMAAFATVARDGRRSACLVSTLTITLIPQTASDADIRIRSRDCVGMVRAYGFGQRADRSSSDFTAFLLLPPYGLKVNGTSSSVWVKG